MRRKMTTEKIRYKHVSGREFDSFEDAVDWWKNNEFDDLFEEVEDD